MRFSYIFQYLLGIPLAFAFGKKSYEIYKKFYKITNSKVQNVILLKKDQLNSSKMLMGTIVKGKIYQSLSVLFWNTQRCGFGWTSI